MKEKCPDCGGKVQYYHDTERTRMVCADKCQGYKVLETWDIGEQIKCENCGKHPVAYTCESWCKENPERRLCCVCIDQMITLIPGVKEALNIKVIKEKNNG